MLRPTKTYSWFNTHHLKLTNNPRKYEDMQSMVSMLIIHSGSATFGDRNIHSPSMAALIHTLKWSLYLPSYLTTPNNIHCPLRGSFLSTFHPSISSLRNSTFQLDSMPPLNHLPQHRINHPLLSQHSLAPKLLTHNINSIHTTTSTGDILHLQFRRLKGF
jgi:hypothetical protein